MTCGIARSVHELAKKNTAIKWSCSLDRELDHTCGLLQLLDISVSIIAISFGYTEMWWQNMSSYLIINI